MIVTEKLGNLDAFEAGERVIDRLPLEWYETGKRILHKRSQSGKEVVLRFLKESPGLQQDDVVYADSQCLIVVEIIPCDAIVVRPSSLYEMAFVCYEIGNKHLPLFFQNDELLIPYEAPLFRMLQASGFGPRKEFCKLLHQLKTSVSPHAHSSSLFSRILQLTTPSSNE